MSYNLKEFLGRYISPKGFSVPGNLCSRIRISLIPVFLRAHSFRYPLYACFYASSFHHIQSQHQLKVYKYLTLQQSNAYSDSPHCNRISVYSKFDTFISLMQDHKQPPLLLDIYSTAYNHPKWSSCRIGCHPFSFSKNHPQMPDI